MDWVSRAVELRTRTLLIHSVDDEYVPFGPSASLAEKNPEMVTFEPFDGALHTKEWNVDPEDGNGWFAHGSASVGSPEQSRAVGGCWYRQNGPAVRG